MDQNDLALPENDETANATQSNFVAQKQDTKNEVSREIIRLVSKRVRAHHLDYDALRYIFRRIREVCEVRVPKKLKKLVEIPTTQELARFYSAIKNPVHKLVFKTLEGTGLRIGELVAVRVDQVHFDSNQIIVRQGKGSKDRVVVIGNRLKEMLQLHLKGRVRGWLFESSWNYKFTTRRIEQLCEQYRAAAKIEKKLSPHGFRHIYFTRLAEHRVSKEQRAILAGHANDSMQDAYTHLSLGAFKSQIIEIMDNLE